MKKVTPEDLVKFPLVVRTRNDDASRSEKILRRLNKAGVKPNIAMRYESFDAVKAAIKSGGGVGILHHDLIQEEIRRKEFSILKIAGLDLQVKSYILYAKKKPLSAFGSGISHFITSIGSVAAFRSTSCRIPHTARLVARLRFVLIGRFEAWLVRPEPRF